MPDTPFTTTFEIVLCQPMSLSIFARKPAAIAGAGMTAVEFVVSSQPSQSGQITMISRWPNCLRYAAASSFVLQPDADT
ncbi:Uncharacterised protein [Burkholderia pseudomallei]|nr:Uncharacterised protein [Burkholderia pseudomallei]CAJ4567900.1 Uncharacterised protein [Burkholderia pseudomallei]VBF70554.1 Uncharacterised protein [Burkholderia pseudomallei]VBK54683.1 Uncharacterised protein [Burkholderia pseudomallei]